MSVLGKTLAAIRHPVLVFRLWRKARSLRPCRHKWGSPLMPPGVDTFVRRCKRPGCEHVQMWAPSLQWVDCGLSRRTQRTATRRDALLN